MIKRFKITKLFGFRDVDIPFENDIKILIGENGLGKTTILNSLYYILSNKLSRLNDIDFEEIELQFNDDNKIKFTKKELSIFLQIQLSILPQIQRRYYRGRTPKKDIFDQIDLDEIKKLISEEKEKEKDTDNIQYEKIFQYLVSNNIPKWAPHSYMIRDLKILIKDIEVKGPDIKKFISYRNIIDSYNITVMYFPTYRRVEEDLKNLQSNKASNLESDEETDEETATSNDTLINFGIKDV